MKPTELKINMFDYIGNRWGLVCEGEKNRSDLMTVSWGGTGVLWGKNVVFVFIRESRYTKELIDSNGLFSLSFLPEEYREAMKTAGTKSGRDGDKWRECGLVPIYTKEGYCYPSASEYTFFCRKLAAVPVGSETFIDPSILPDWYDKGDFHTMYIGEITDVYGIA